MLRRLTAVSAAPLSIILFMLILVHLQPPGLRALFRGARPETAAPQRTEA